MDTQKAFQLLENKEVKVTLSDRSIYAIIDKAEVLGVRIIWNDNLYFVKYENIKDFAVG